MRWTRNCLKNWAGRRMSLQSSPTECSSNWKNVSRTSSSSGKSRCLRNRLKKCSAASEWAGAGQPGKETLAEIATVRIPPFAIPLRPPVIAAATKPIVDRCPPDARAPLLPRAPIDPPGNKKRRENRGVWLHFLVLQAFTQATSKVSLSSFISSSTTRLPILPGPWS